ncbi:hypothetical protein DFO54_10890 [Erwinia sp. AG740]|nr:hypothetical protein DFO54_10890 [Erwinia sp. AG740]
MTIRVYLSWACSFPCFPHWVSGTVSWPDACLTGVTLRRASRSGMNVVLNKMGTALRVAMCLRFIYLDSERFNRNQLK